MPGHIPHNQTDGIPPSEFAVTVEFVSTNLTDTIFGASLDTDGDAGSESVSGVGLITTFCVAHRDFIIDDVLLELSVGADSSSATETDATGAIQIQICDPDDAPGEGTNVLDEAVNLATDVDTFDGVLLSLSSAGGGYTRDDPVTETSLDFMPKSSAGRLVKRGQRVDIVLVGQANVDRGLATLVGNYAIDANVV